MTSTINAAIGAVVLLSGAYLLRMKMERDDRHHRENRPQDFWHGIDISAAHRGTAEERKIQGRLVAKAATMSDRLNPADFGVKYAQLRRDYASGRFKFDN